MTAPLRLFDSLTRELETFEPIHDGEARVYTCGPTVYNYPHIRNMSACVFADVVRPDAVLEGLIPTFQIAHSRSPRLLTRF